jgi:hypothetical protein
MTRKIQCPFPGVEAQFSVVQSIVPLTIMMMMIILPAKDVLTTTRERQILPPPATLVADDSSTAEDDHPRQTMVDLVSCESVTDKLPDEGWTSPAQRVRGSASRAQKE